MHDPKATIRVNDLGAMEILFQSWIRVPVVDDGPEGISGVPNLNGFGSEKAT